VLPFATRADEVLVSAAASLTDAFKEIGAAYSKSAPGTVVRFNFGASGALLQQIQQGAPVDVFASAAPQEMDTLQRANRLVPGTRIDFAGNRLVLIVAPGSRIRDWKDLATPAVHRIALSNPTSVPSGRYAREALTRHGLWGAIQPKLVMGENVRQTLAYVTGGDADAGLVYATDASIAGAKVRVAREAVPGRDHAPIVYPAAVVTEGPNPGGARRFVQFLGRRTAQQILARYGFSPVRKAPTMRRP
jgi:molybdate transport system substrate-binding protein